MNSLDVSSPIRCRVYNLGLDEFFSCYTEEPRAGFTKATVAAWRVALEARGLGAVSINVRITAARKLWRRLALVGVNQTSRSSAGGTLEAADLLARYCDNATGPRTWPEGL